MTQHNASATCALFHHRMQRSKSKRAIFCRWCGDYVEFGPANDAPAEVNQEIGAAMLAVIPEWWNSRQFEPQSYGVLQFYNGGTPGADDDGGCAEYAYEEHIGWLAAAIGAHQERA